VILSINNFREIREELGFDIKLKNPFKIKFAYNFPE
jgi:hypothetical protein